MPELPQVQALADALTTRLSGLAVTGVEVGSVAALKTFDPAPGALAGSIVAGVHRHGKFLDLDCDGLHLITHLARAGWLRLYENAPTARLRPGRSPIALRVRFSDGSGFDLTEAGTRKGLAVYIVREATDVPGIASLGVDPLSPELTREAFAALLGARHRQVKGLLRDQSLIAGVGNAYSDEVLHAARLSPFAPTTTLSEEQITRLYEALRSTLTAAVAAAAGTPAADLKDAKRASMAVHGRSGAPCPVCGETIRDVSFADSSLQYCPTCQTSGTVLADRRMSKLLK